MGTKTKIKSQREPKIVSIMRPRGGEIGTGVSSTTEIQFSKDHHRQHGQKNWVWDLLTAKGPHDIQRDEAIIRRVEALRQCAVAAGGVQ